MSLEMKPSHTDYPKLTCNTPGCPVVLYVSGPATPEGIRAGAALTAGWSSETTSRSTKDFCDRCTRERSA